MPKEKTAATPRYSGRMIMLHRPRACALAVLAAALLVATPASAQQSVADFYKGKNVALLLGTGPGGSYDLYAPHLRRAPRQAHPGQSEHRRRAHAGRGRRHRRQSPVRPGSAGRHQDPALARDHHVGDAGPEGGRALPVAEIQLDRHLRRHRAHHGALARGAGEDHRRSEEGRRSSSARSPRRTSPIRCRR